MASHDLARKLASCVPIRRIAFPRCNTCNNSMTVPQGVAKGRCMSSAAQKANPNSKESQIQKREDDALYTAKSSPLRAFDLMDSFFPTRNLLSMIQSMDRIFDEPFLAPSAFRESPIKRSVRIPWDFAETDDAFKLRLDMPGFGKEDVKVYVEDDCLVIKGEHKEEEQWTSRHHGSYSTRISLPSDAKVEEIKADLNNGVLTVTVPKLKEEERKKTIIDVQIQ